MQRCPDRRTRLHTDAEWRKKVDILKSGLCKSANFCGGMCYQSEINWNIMNFYFSCNNLYSPSVFFLLYSSTVHFKLFSLSCNCGKWMLLNYCREKNTRLIREAIRVRYMLLPYFYTLFREANTTGLPVMRPLWMEFPSDETTFSNDEAFMVGSSLLVQGIYTEVLLTKMFLHILQWILLFVLYLL